MDRDDYYEYHESKEALAEGQLPSDPLPFPCPFTNAAPMKNCCVYFIERWSHEEFGYVCDFDCTYPGGPSKCPFPKEDRDGQADED